MEPDERLQIAIGRWIPSFDLVEGWKEWKHRSFGATLWHDDDHSDVGEPLDDFLFPPDVAKEHEIVTSYYALVTTLISLRDCEYYFRRFPFNNLPVAKHDHLRYTCENYFSRFYEFSERLKSLFAAIKSTNPKPLQFEYGKVIKSFSREFDQELRQRNRVHHHNRFEDVAIDNLMLLSMEMPEPKWTHLQRRNNAAYRRASREWAQRVIDRAKAVEVFLRLAAKIVLAQCQFLSNLDPIFDAVRAKSGAGGLPN